MSKNYNLEYYSEEKILNPPQHSKDEIDLIIKLLSKNKNKKIAEFGSGGGRLTIPLLQNGYQITAIEIDKKSQKQLLNTTIKIKKSKNLQVYSRLPKNKKYDYILGTDILHHIEIDKYFKIFSGHLKKGGKIIFSEPNPWNISWIIFITLFLDWKQEKGIIKCSFFSIKNKLKKSGFKNIDIIGFSLFPPQLFSKALFLKNLNYFLGNLPILKLFSFRLILQAEK